MLVNAAKTTDRGDRRQETQEVTYLDGREKRKRRRSVGRMEPGKRTGEGLGDGRELRPSKCLLDNGES